MTKPLTASEIFAMNVRRLKGDASQGSVGAGAKRAGKKTVDQRTVGRNLKGGNPTLSTIESIACSLKVQPWQLLVPENVLHFPKIGLASEVIDVASRLNEPGIAAALAMIKGLADRPEFLADTPNEKEQ